MKAQDGTPKQTSSDTLQNRQLDLKVVEQHVKSAESRLKQLRIAEKRAEDNVRRLQLEVQQLGLQKKTLTHDITLTRNRLEKEIANSKKAIDALKFEKKSLEEELKQQKKYLKEQQGVVDQAIEEANQELLSKKYELEQKDKDLKDVFLEISKATSLLDEVRMNIESEAKVLEAFSERKREANAQIEAAQKEADTIIHQTWTRKAEIDEQVDQKLAILKTKEESLITREDALQVRTQELAQRERRLNSAERLYS